MEPITLRIHKAKTVPTNIGSKYQKRTDWCFVVKIGYDESIKIFKSIGGDRSLGISTDAQIAKWLKDNFGYGRYQLYFFKKKIKGWSFYSFDCSKEDRWCLVKKEKSKKKKEEEALLKDYKQKQNEIKEAENDIEKELIKEDLEEMESEMEINDVIYEDDDKKVRKKVRPFRITSPSYHEHEYEDYGNERKKGGEVKYRRW